MASRRSQAYRVIRDEIGKEICPDIRDVKYAIDDLLPHLEVSRRPDARKLKNTLDHCCTTTHNLRRALMSLLTLHKHPELTVCPHCERPLEDHNPKCLLDRLLRQM